MQLLALFCILVVAHGAPYVHHEEVSTVNPDPTENTETGPQMRKMNGETNSNLFRDLFSFMDVFLFANRTETKSLILRQKFGETRTETENRDMSQF